MQIDFRPVAHNRCMLNVVAFVRFDSPQQIFSLKRRGTPAQHVHIQFLRENLDHAANERLNPFVIQAGRHDFQYPPVVRQSAATVLSYVVNQGYIGRPTHLRQYQALLGVRVVW
jgi:hypothetical protein